MSASAKKVFKEVKWWIGERQGCADPAGYRRCEGLAPGKETVMAKVLLRCRDAEMIGPLCDYVTESDTFDEAVREMRVHAMTHHERDITDEDVAELKSIFMAGETGAH